MKKTVLSFCVIALSVFISCTDGSDPVVVPETVDTSTPEPITTIDNATIVSDGPFQVKAGVVEFLTKDLDGNLLEDTKIYTFENYGNLVKLEETFQGDRSVYLYNYTTKKGMVLREGKTEAQKSYGAPGEINEFTQSQGTAGGGFTQLVNENIAGKDCEVQENNGQRDGKSTYIFWSYKGITLKAFNNIMGKGYIKEAVNFEERAVPLSEFAFPDGIVSPVDIFSEE